MNENKQRKPGLNKMYVCLVLLILNTLLMTSCASGELDKQISRYTDDLPFCMPEIITPSFPNYKVNIIDYGAVGDGHTKNTDAFASAIQACAEAGGGRVVVPPGIWLTGPIKLQSNINLHVEKGAVILFSGQFDDYPLIQTSWEGLPGVRCISPIYGINLENIAITGEGIIDGSGDAWRPVKKFKMTERQWKVLLASGGVVNKKGTIWWPSEQALNGANLIEALSKRDDVTLKEYAAAREFLRPVMVALVQCKNVLLDGPTFQNSPAWNIHPLMCEDVVIRNITIRNPWYSQNGDGLDIESCRNVVVYNCRFDVGDDAICLKSGKNEYGRLRGKPSENIAIADCIVYHGHGGFTIGSEMSGGIRNISIRNCTFLGTDVGIRFKSTRGRGGVVENIFIQDILMKDIPTDAIRFNMYYNYQAPIPEDDNSNLADSKQKHHVFQVSEETPIFRKIYLKNIICKGAARAVLLQGLPEMAIQHIELDNVMISSKTGLVCVDADQIKLTNVTIIPEDEPVFSLYDSRNVIIQNAEFPRNIEILIKLDGDKTQGIYLMDVDVHQMREKIQLAKNVKSNAIILQ